MTSVLIPVNEMLLLEKVEDTSPSGLYLPSSNPDFVKARVLKAGPGFPHLDPISKTITYIPLEAKEGDIVLLPPAKYPSLRIEGKEYILFPFSKIYLIMREESTVEEIALC